MLRGSRLILRPMRRDDAARQHEFDQDLELYGLDCSLPQVAPLEQAEAFLELVTRPDESTAWFAIESDGTYIGNCGLFDLTNRNGSFEMGIVIGDRAYWGRGYGREAVRLLLDYGFRHLGARRIWASPHAKNERAFHCYRACGFVEEGRPRQVLYLEGEFVDVIDLSILRDEWQAQQAALPA